MRVFVDTEYNSDTKDRFFCYTNDSGELEGVVIQEGFNTTVSIGMEEDVGADYFVIYKKDIPKMIKALQAAQEYVNGDK